MWTKADRVVMMAEELGMHLEPWQIDVIAAEFPEDGMPIEIDEETSS